MLQKIRFCRVKFKNQFSFKVEMKGTSLYYFKEVWKKFFWYMYQIAASLSQCWRGLINTIEVLVIARGFAFVRSRLQAKARLQLQVSNGQLEPSVFMVLMCLTLSLYKSVYNGRLFCIRDLEMFSHRAPENWFLAICVSQRHIIARLASQLQVDFVYK